MKIAARVYELSGADRYCLAAVIDRTSGEDFIVAMSVEEAEQLSKALNGAISAHRSQRQEG
jgi:hypothetical protein